MIRLKHEILKNLFRTPLTLMFEFRHKKYQQKQIFTNKKKNSFLPQNKLLFIFGFKKTARTIILCLHDQYQM